MRIKSFNEYITEELRKVISDEEILEDNLIEITDKFDIMLRPGLFLVDVNGKLETNKDGVVMYSSFPDVEVQKIDGNLIWYLLENMIPIMFGAG